MDSDKPILTVRGVSKRFGGVHALKEVDLTMKKGCITALIGENGAGKSTLVKILAGFHQPDEGVITVDGTTVSIKDVHYSSELGISVIHQIPSFAPHLSVVDNIFLGKEIPYRNRSWIKRYDRKREVDRVRPLIAQYGGDFSPLDRLGKLKAYQQRLAGILKALVFEARILILDEPTAALPLEEREHLLTKIKQLKTEGYSILYVSHHFDEIEKVADEIVALRDGELAGYSDAVPSQSAMIEMMTGYPLDDISRIYVSDGESSDPVATTITEDDFLFHLSPPVEGNPDIVVHKSIDFTFRSGELTVLSGMVGSGVKEVAEAMFGMRSGWTTTYRRSGTVCEISSPGVAISNGIGYLSDDRIGEAMVPDFSVRKNLTLPKLNKVANLWGHIRAASERRITEKLCKDLTVKMSSIEQPAADLSGGNQQKIMLARWLFSEVDLLILNEPTQGIDVKAKQDVMGLLNDFTSSGGACLIVTNDPEEFIHQAQRIIVMRRGDIAGDFRASEIRRDEIKRTMLIQQ